MIVDLYLIRHAPVLGAKEKLYQTANEPADLSQGSKLDKLAARLPADASWFSSPLQRAETTAQALKIRQKDTTEITLDHRLTEQDFGDWFGLSFEDLWQEIKILPPHNWSLLAAESCPPGGESFQAVWDRVGGFLDDFKDQDKKDNRIIISHAGVIRAMMGHILQLSPDKALSFALAPLSMTHVQYCDTRFRGGQWRLVTVNENFGE